MNEFKELCKELEQHREAMFFTIGRTIQDAAQLFDHEFLKSIEAIAKIYDEKYQTFKSKQTGLSDDDYWNWIESKYLENYNNRYFTVNAFESYDHIRSCLSPLTDDKAYLDFLLLTNYTGKQQLQFCEQLFFLAGAFRFYSQIGTSPTPNIDINKDVSMILKIDREIAFIREDIYSAMASRKNSSKNAKGTTGTNLSNELKKTDPLREKSDQYQDIYLQTAKELKMKKRKITFGAFIENAAPKIPLSVTGLRNHLAAVGVSKENFEEWLTNLPKKNKRYLGVKPR